jgi:hypothetical protein
VKTVLCALLFVAAQASVKPAITGTIRGQVVDAGGGSVIADADIRLQPAGPTALQTKSDRDGRFEVSGVATGAYVLTVQRDGFFASVNGAMEIAAAVPVLVKAGNDPPELRIELNRAALISGRVIDGAGQLLSNARVRAFAAPRGGALESVLPAATKFSDNRGEYRLFWLLPGDYVIQAEPPGSATGLVGSSLKAFHPNGARLESATRLTLHAGDSLSGIDIALSPSIADPTSQTLKISGQVLSTLTGDGRAMPAAAALMLLPHDSADESSPRNAGASDSRTGRFEISPVTPGVYDLYARVRDPRGSPSGRGAALAWGRVVVEARDTDVDNVRLIVHPSVNVRGVVKAAGSGVALPPGIRVELEPLGSSARLVNIRGMIDVTEGVRPDGSFTIGVVAEGTYRIRLLGLPSDIVIAEVRQGGRDIIESGFEVRAADPLLIEVRIRRSR